ncbi:MAG: hypothetical protein D6793_09670, partial [Thermoflexia bacterium]
MNPRKTTTGQVLEQMVLPALQHGNYTYKRQVAIGERLGGGQHKVDLVVTSAQGEKILVSLKWQQASGTAEQKVPYEIMCLAEAIRSSEEFSRAYIVLGGGRWSKREYFIGGAWQE